MVQKILAAVDGSKSSEAILPYLELMLSGRDSNLTLATVIKKSKAKNWQDAKEALEAFSSRIRQKGAFVDVAVLTGDAGDQIVKYAQGSKYDVVVLATRGLTGLKRTFSGSVAEAILRTSAVPVLITRIPTKPVRKPKIERILVPLDGSHRSAGIVPAAAGLAVAHGARLHLVTVVAPDRKTDNLPLNVVLENLFNAQAELQEKGVDAEASVLYGDPAKEILQYAEDRGIDLVALATHGRTGMERLLYGSVAEAILKKGKTPLMVVRTAMNKKVPLRHHRAARAGARAVSFLKEAGHALSGSPYNR